VDGCPKVSRTLSDKPGGFNGSMQRSDQTHIKPCEMPIARIGDFSFERHVCTFRDRDPTTRMKGTAIREACACNNSIKNRKWWLT